MIGDGRDASSAGGSGLGLVKRSIILDLFACVCVCVCVSVCVSVCAEFSVAVGG